MIKFIPSSGLIFFGGVVLGSVLTYLILSEYYEEKLERDVEDIRAAADRQLARQRKNVESAARKAAEEDKKEAEEVSNKLGYSKPDPAVLAKQVEETEEVEDDEEDSPFEEDPVDYENYYQGKWKSEETKGYTPPKIISFEKFNEHNPAYEQETLYFYMGNQVLANERDDIVDDIPHLIGDSLTKYGFDSNDERGIYVRNSNVGKDYEIIKIFGDFNPGPDI